MRRATWQAALRELSFRGRRLRPHSLPAPLRKAPSLHSCYASRVRGARTALAVALSSSIALIAVTTTHDARASEEKGRTSSLSWLRMPGSDSCIATQALARSVEERLGRRVFVSAAEADVSVEGR